MPEESKAILVEVLNGAQVNMGGCSCCSSGCASADSCGPAADTDYADLTAQMTKELKEVYGEKVEVQYVDVDQAGLDKYPIMKQVLQMGYPYPITLINGQPKFAGGIMTPEIKQLIEETLNDKAN
ncbi:MAG: hypothetical protein VB084_11855 [Syntrophomonadaceae bacterium]|nr:hypothetical protein [Syntrophomonadaceae bacterium]